MRKNQGITLIALIITIIVMLILVGVVVQVVIQSNLLGTAKSAGDKYKTAYEEESKMSEVTINGKQYGSIEEYMEEINLIKVEPDNIDDWIYVVEDDGTITINGYKGSDTEVVIPNYINGVPVKKIGFVSHELSVNGDPRGNFWDPSICSGEQKFSYWYIQNDITSVTISNGIEELIYQYTFAFSDALEKVVIPPSVKTVPSGVVGCCSNLKSIYVSWKEGEKPEGWADGWSDAETGNVIVYYAE